MFEVSACVLLCCVFKSVTCEVRSTQDQRQGVVKQSLSTPRLHTSVSVLCNRNCPNSVNGTKTWELCETQDVLRMEGRCCVNTTHDAKSSSIVSVLGIDLQKCNIKEEEFATGIQNLSFLAVISLEGNPMKNIKAEDFNSNIGIQYLSLPANMTCPGGSDAWNQIETERTRTVCLQELNPCRYQNFTCPKNSHCEQAGVNQTECLCDVGFHGYKCLSQGTFPVLPFAVGLAVPTVVLGLLLWLTQRRYVKPKTT